MNKKTVISWALYDWANSAFAVTVIAGFFPIFLKLYWAAEVSPQESTYYLGLANSSAGLILFIFAPILGAISDHSQSKKRFLFFFSYLGILTCSGLAFIAKGNWQWALSLYILAFIGFTQGETFYNSLLTSVATIKQLDFISSLGYASGYIGGGLFFLFSVIMYLKPEWFGIASSVTSIKLSFILVGIWWALFSLPIFLLFKEKKLGGARGVFSSISQGIKQLKNTAKQIKQHKKIFYFLIAYWFYIDGATTLIKMAVDYGVALGFPPSSLIIALLLVQFVAFPATLLYYKFGQFIGVKRAILLAILAYSVATVLGAFISTPLHFYLLAIVIGCFQGGLFALSRSYYAKLIPQNQEGEFFGFFSMWTRFASLLGPFLVGIVAKYSGNSRIAILAIVILFLIGAFLFYRTTDDNRIRRGNE